MEENKFNKRKKSEASFNPFDVGKIPPQAPSME
jgi:hypothetical protein